MKQVISTVLLISIFIVACKEKNVTPQPIPLPTSPGMCTLLELGEAANVIENKTRIPDNQYISLDGMSDPRTLVWQDINTKQIFYAIKLVGSEGRLFYLDTLKTGETPKMKTRFTGTIIHWKYLEPPLASAISRQYKENWKVDIDQSQTHIILGRRKPSDCK